MGKYARPAKEQDGRALASVRKESCENGFQVGICVRKQCPNLGASSVGQACTSISTSCSLDDPNKLSRRTFASKKIYIFQFRPAHACTNHYTILPKQIDHKFHQFQIKGTRRLSYGATLSFSKTRVIIQNMFINSCYTGFHANINTCAKT